MTIDLTKKTTELLNLIANSLYDREDKSIDSLYFSSSERAVVEQFLQDLLVEYEHDKERTD